MRNEKGISLTETLLVVVVAGAMVLLMANLPNAIGLINKSKHLSLAREIASKQLEDKRNISYANLVNDSVNISDTRLSLLPAGSGTITVEDCDSSICTNSESIKKVSVTVTWQDNNKLQTVTLRTLIGQGGIN